MSATAGIVIGLVVLLVLAPFVAKLARRWQRGTSAFVAGGIAGSAAGDAGMGQYITRLRKESDRNDGDESDAAGSDFDTNVSYGDTGGGESGPD